MKDVIVRLQEIQLVNFKNVENGKITLQSYNNKKKDIQNNNSEADILGIYGQNGSGKTALINALSILKVIMSGERLPKNTINLISATSNKCVLKFVFLIEHEDERFLAYYDLEIRKNSDDNIAEICRETLSYASLNGETKKNKIIDSDNDDMKIVFRPMNKYNELISSNKDNLLNLSVAKVLAKKEKKSFIFNDDSTNIFHNGFKNSPNYSNIIISLSNFAKINLFVIDNEQLGIINMNQLIPFTFRLENKENVISGDCFALFEKSNVSEKTYRLLDKIKNQINIVISAIVPGLNIDIVNYGNELDKNGNMKMNIELVSIREEKRIPLKYESEGIKKIISILSAIIAMYNNRTICLAVDELDAGVFEYLLGEMLDVLQENAKGQFIFTSHNLRVLEKLNKESIVFTTTNPKNRYIRLGNVKSNNNLRDFYLRGISLGGQKEELYESTNTFEINYAFKRAGKIAYEE
ncbi:AAA family ATPase [Haloimpatiens sp. FM7315]|uniref:AAA family ATPase n=1 Tax=Haloimpatiens sp. FM7315 TaxID=3298609 RepID=UPI00370C8960